MSELPKSLYFYILLNQSEMKRKQTYRNYQVELNITYSNLIMKKTEAYFIPHCDNETCDLGAFQYTCPHCNKTVSDYMVWWKQDDILIGNPETFTCEKCGKSLIVEWNSDDGEYCVH